MPAFAYRPSRAWWAGALAATLVAAPELVVVAFLGFSVGPLLCLLAGEFHPYLVLPLAIIGAAVALAVYRPRPEPTDRAEVLAGGAALAFTVAWGGLNQFFSAQDVFAIRDPATYNLAGRWLMDHSSLQIDTHLAVFGSIRGLEPGSAGFGYTKTFGVLYAQGNHLLPALLAVAGWIFGEGGLLRANVVITAFALLVSYGLARRLVGPVWGLLAMVALGVSMPLLFVGRDDYTETLSMLFLLGGLSLLHRALQHWRYRDFVLAGAATGISAAVRIDSYVSVVALELALALVLLAQPRARRLAATQRVLALGAGAALTMLAGWLDVTQLANGYYHDQHAHILALVKVIAVLFVLLPLVVAIGWRVEIVNRLRGAAWRRGVTVAAGVGLAVAGVALYFRPHWQTTIGEPNVSLAALQAEQALPVDGNRLYNEYTLHWLAYYVGWPVVVLALAGYLVLVAQAVWRGRLTLIAPLATGLALSVLYLWSSQITPDQPWASRRYVPVVLPLLLMAAVAAARCLATWLRRRWWALGWVATLLAIVVIAGTPLRISRPVWRIREEVPQLSQVERICSALPEHAVVLLVDESAELGYAQTLRSYCGLDAMSLLKPTTSQLDAVNSAVRAGGQLLYLLGMQAGTFAAVAGTAVAPFSQITMTRWPSVINQRPTEAIKVVVSVYLASMQADGTVVAISR